MGGVLRHTAGIEEFAFVPQQILHAAQEGQIQGNGTGEHLPPGQTQTAAEACADAVAHLAAVLQLDRAETLAAADEFFHALAVFLREHIRVVRAALIHVDVRAAHQADQQGAFHLVVDEYPGQETEDQILQEDEAQFLIRDRHQPREVPRPAGHNAEPLPAVLGLENRHGVDELVLKEREGLLAPDDLGGEQRQDVGEEILFQKRLPFIRKTPEAAQFHPIAGRQLVHQRVEDLVPPGQQGAGALQHGGDLLVAGHAQFVVGDATVQRVHQHPHPDHVELVQVALEDG